MSIFCAKSIQPTVRVGTQLYQERDRQNLTLEQVSTATRIGKKYLTAIEDGRFDDLPDSKPFRLSYVREYARYLHLDPKCLVAQFRREGGLTGVSRLFIRRHTNFFHFTSFPYLARNVVIAAVVILFGSYLVWQVAGIVKPPTLAVYSPPEGFITSSKNILIQGRTEPECRLMINGKEARPDESGNFSIGIDLSAGVNTVTISAIKKHGKTTTETRHVIARVVEK